MMNERLREAIGYFTRETQVMSDLAVACGQGDRLAWARDGETVRAETLFDLASVTKLFTGLCAMRLREEGKLDFRVKAAELDPRFVHLRDVTVEQLISFRCNLQTPVRIDACPDRERALASLFAVKNSEAPARRPYSDIPAMVLKYLLEAAAAEPLADCIRRTVLERAGMRETFARVPEERLCDCMSYEEEYRIEGARHILRRDWKPGVPHDPKAAILQGDTGDLCGHAGLFSTLEDMIRLARAILEEKIISRDSLREMAVNRTGRPLEEGGFSQYLGYLCYVRHPDQHFSEVPAYMGRQAFGMAGFTGNHFSVDPERGIFAVFLGNRVKRRLTVLLPEEGKTLTDYGLQEDGLGRIQREDGVTVPSSVHYVYQKDDHLHSVIAGVLGLETIPFL